MYEIKNLHVRNTLETTNMQTSILWFKDKPAKARNHQFLYVRCTDKLIQLGCYIMYICICDVASAVRSVDLIQNQACV